MLVKAPAAFHSLPHWHSDRGGSTRNLRLREVYRFIQNHQLKGVEPGFKLRSVSILNLFPTQPLWFFRLLSGLRPGYSENIRRLLKELGHSLTAGPGCRQLVQKDKIKISAGAGSGWGWVQRFSSRFEISDKCSDRC